MLGHGLPIFGHADRDAERANRDAERADRDVERDAERTERYLDDLIAANAHGAQDAPTDAGVDPAVVGAARTLRASLVRVHPSFAFGEALAERLAVAAERLRTGMPVGPEIGGQPSAATVTPFPLPFDGAALDGAALDGAALDGAALDGAALDGAALDTSMPVPPWRAILPAAALRRLPEVTSRSSRPFIFGGVGVASAAISLGAVYVAWRHSRPTSGRMERAVKAAHDRPAGSGRGRRSGFAHGIFGVMS